MPTPGARGSCGPLGGGSRERRQVDAAQHDRQLVIGSSLLGPDPGLRVGWTVDSSPELTSRVDEPTPLADLYSLLAREEAIARRPFGFADAA